MVNKVHLPHVAVDVKEGWLTIVCNLVRAFSLEALKIRLKDSSFNLLENLNVSLAIVLSVDHVQTLKVLHVFGHGDVDYLCIARVFVSYFDGVVVHIVTLLFRVVQMRRESIFSIVYSYYVSISVAV